jgi:hypothetical protein
MIDCATLEGNFEMSPKGSLAWRYRQEPLTNKHGLRPSEFWPRTVQDHAATKRMISKAFRDQEKPFPFENLVRLRIYNEMHGSTVPRAIYPNYPFERPMVEKMKLQKVTGKSQRNNNKPVYGLEFSPDG